MPRTPTIRYYASREAYYTQYRGRQHLLAAGPRDEPDGPTYQAAARRYAHLMHAGELNRTEDGCLVSAAIARYYRSLELEGRGSTLKLARSLLDPAIADFGHVKVRELKPVIVTDWLDRMSDPARDKGKGRERPWNTTTRSTATSVLCRAFNWSKSQGVIKVNPIAGMARPERLARGKDVLIPEPLQDLLISSANRELSKVLRMLRGTGARPGEIIHADCGHYQPSIPALVYPWNPPPGAYRWKNGKKTKRDRVIYLTPEFNELVAAEIRARGGRGRIFLTLRGRFHKDKRLAEALHRLAARKPVRLWCRENRHDADKLIPYGFRHSYITRMLRAGCPVKLLADLCGTSVAMIERTYSHVHDDHAAMMRLVLQFTSA